MKRFPKGGVRKNVQEFVDADYLHKLTPKEREWYDDFIRSEYQANRQSAAKIKGKPLTKKETQRLDKINNSRRADAHNRLDRSAKIDNIMSKIEDSE